MNTKRIINKIETEVIKSKQIINMHKTQGSGLIPGLPIFIDYPEDDNLFQSNSHIDIQSIERPKLIRHNAPYIDYNSISKDTYQYTSLLFDLCNKKNNLPKKPNK